MTLRCDLRLDCPDDSDESGCSIVDFPPGYKNIIPPPSEDPEEPLPILFPVNIIAFPSIKTQELIFESTLQIKLRWRDSRLNFKNLKEDKTLNLLSRQSAENIWKPIVFFQNAFGKVYTNFDEGAKIECIPEGFPSPGDKSREEESKELSSKS